MKCRHGINLTNMSCNSCDVAMEQDPSYEYTDVEIYDLGGSGFAKWLESCPVKFSVGAIDMGGTRADVTFWIDDEDYEGAP